MSICNRCKPIIGAPDEILIGGLYGCICFSHYTCLEMLIKSGVNINAVDDIGNGVLHLPIFSARLVDLLISIGANINMRNIFGKTPLHFGYSEEAVNAFIKHGADITLLTTSGETPLHCVQRCDAMKALLENGGIDINARDKHGYTALYYSCKNGNMSACILLLEHGAKLELMYTSCTEKIYKLSDDTFIIGKYQIPTLENITADVIRDMKPRDLKSVIPSCVVKQHFYQLF